MTGRHGGGHTIGVAVGIPSPFREELEAARERYEPSDHALPAHVTILAPVDVDADAMAAVFEHLERVTAETAQFTLQLQGSGSFRPVSPVVFVNVVAGGSDCERIERLVRSGDMAVETRFPYHPHVTVAHGVGEETLDRALADLAGYSASAQITSLGLYEHDDEGWRLLREFPFGG